MVSVLDLLLVSEEFDFLVVTIKVHANDNVFP